MIVVGCEFGTSLFVSAADNLKRKPRSYNPNGTAENPIT